MASTAGEKELKRDWPITSGIEADEKHEGRTPALVAQEESLVPQKDLVGIR